MDPETALRRMVACWVDEADPSALESLVAPSYVHHAMHADTDVDGFRQGLAWIAATFTDRAYEVRHVVVEGDLAAAHLRWTGTRSVDGSRVSGAGSYHLRLGPEGVVEDWDVWFPVS